MQLKEVINRVEAAYGMGENNCKSYIERLISRICEGLNNNDKK